MSQSKETPSKGGPIAETAIRRLLLLGIGILLIPIVIALIASARTDSCEDWRADYRAIIGDLGEVTSEDARDYPENVDTNQVNRVRREAVVQALVALNDERPDGCKAP
jgi:hypothetical protein